MHDRHHGEHEGGHHHAHEHHKGKKEEGVPEIIKLRKMVEHWINHNEEHAGSYRAWASRARESGCEQPGEILEEIASLTLDQNERFMKIIQIIDSTFGSD